MRYHELSLQKWLYSRFFVYEGYSVPCVFASPMDAFGLFQKLWSDANNPFAYLLNLKDEHGTPLYEPFPSPIRYPLISVMRKGIKYRPYQNFSIHQWRHINWPTVSDAGSVIPGKQQQGAGLVKCDLANVTVSRMPMAFDYRFQIDHYCLRPDTQAFYVERLLNQFWRTGGTLQTWMEVNYPGWDSQYIRMYVDGEIDQTAPDEASYQDKNVEFRTSFTLVVEGFSIDVQYEVLPALWKLIATTAQPDQLDKLLEPVFEVDLRPKGYNYVLESRPDVPSAGTCQIEGLRNQYLAAGTVHILLGDLAGTLPGDNVYDPNRNPPGYGPSPIVITPAFSFGIPSGLAFGTPIFTHGTYAPAIHSCGTDSVGAALGLGNIGQYLLFNNVNAGTLSTSAFGTHFLATVPFASGTDAGTFSTEVFGTYTNVTVFDNAGTEVGTLSTSAFGAATLTVFATDSGTGSGTWTTSAFGTHLLVSFEANCGTNFFGSLSTSAFGTYTPGS